MGTFIENINTLANAAELAAGDAVADTILARDQAEAAALLAEAAALEAAANEDLSQDWADKGYGIPVTGTVGVDAKYSAYHWATVAQQMLGDPLINDSITSTLYTWSSNKINTSLVAKAAIDHLHTGVYEPAFTKNTAFNRNFSTAGGDYGSSTDVARKDHTHSTLYEPKRTTLGTAYNKNFGTVVGTVAEGNHLHTGVYMPYAAQGTAYNKNFVANIDAPLSTEIPRGNHVHKASGISYDSTGNTVVTSTTVQGAVGQLDATLGTFSIAEKSKISVGMTDSTYVVSIGAVGSGVLVNAGMTTLSYSKNAIYSNGVQINYEVNPTKFIEGSYDATVSIDMAANTQYGISIAKNGVAIGSTFKALGGSTSSPAGTYAVSISGFVSNLVNGDTLGLLVYNMTNTNSVTLRSMTVSWAGQPEGAIISAGATVNHADVTSRDAINQHPTTSIYEPGSNRALDLLLDDKADRVGTPILDNMLSMDINGNLKDSGISTATINNKMSKIAIPTSDNIVAMTSTGDSKDTGMKVSDLAKVGGESTQVFEVGTATLATHAVRKEVVDTKAPLASPTFTGNIVTNGNIRAGQGSGSVALTVNDGGGNANVTFNHAGMIPDSNGSSARITSAVDGSTASMSFELYDNVTAGTAPTGGFTPLTLKTSGAQLAGTPTAPTAAVGTNTTQIATTAFVIANSSNTLTDLGLTATATELNYVDGVTSAIQTQLNGKAPLASPTLTGIPTAPTAAAGTNTTQVATTAFVQAEIANDTYSKAEVTMAIGNINSPLLDMPLKNSLAMKAGVGSATFTRASTATYIDRYGVLKTASVDEPRFEKEGYLNEGASTNVLIYSEQFDNASWAKSNATIATNTTDTTDPYSTNLADKLIENTATTPHGVSTTSGELYTSGTAYTLSIFAKANTRNYIGLIFWENTAFEADRIAATFNLTTGTVDAVTDTSPNAKIVHIGNGWYRCSITATASATGTYEASRVYMNSTASTTYAYTGDGISSLYIFGAQLEALPFATSYIPTTTAAVTRAKDNLTVPALGNYGRGISAKTIVIDADVLGHSTALYQYGITIGGVTYNLISISHGDQANRSAFFYGAVNYLTTSPITANTKYRFCASISGGATSTINAYTNGVKISTNSQTIATDGTPTNIYIGQGTTGYSNLYGHISNIRVYDKELTATEVALA